MREKILNALKKEIPEAIDIALTVPDNDAFGHYSTNAAFQLARIRRQSPQAAAEALRRALSSNPLFAGVDVAGGGFLNFTLAPRVFTEELKIILKKKGKYGITKPRLFGAKKIQIEFISANPTGPLTLANGRGGFLGDALASILEAAGNKVEREYYVNDTGNQVRTLGKSILAAAGIIPYEETFYQGDYIKEWADGHKALIAEHKENPERLGERAAEYFLGLIKRTVEEKSGIRFDRYTSERNDIHAKGFTDKALALFKKNKATYEQDGAVWLATTRFGDDKDRVLVTSEKQPTYFLADAGHYLETKKRGFAAKINILGPDHYGYMRRIQAAAGIVGLSESKVIITQAVRLMQNGEEVKMSKRRGSFVTFEELVDEIGMDSARFFFLMISPDTHMDFDLGLAKDRSLKNPVFYAQYAYVRALNILKKTEHMEGKPDLSLLTTKEDERLMKLLAEFPDALADTARDYAVHRMTRYALECAKAFHAFYEKERVEGEKKETLLARRALVEATHIVLGTLFSLLGVSLPERM